MKYSLEVLVLVSLAASCEASKAVIEVYNSDFTVDFKKDNSPLTLADKNSHNIIKNKLNKYFPDIPILSEEGKDIPYNTRKNWEYFWLIDPLDGTKEFVKKNGEFTVNIALINKDRSILGVIYVPVQDVVYFAGKDLGAYKLQNASEIMDSLDIFNLNIGANIKEKYYKLLSYSEKLPLNGEANRIDKENVTVIVSRSHMNNETEKFLNELSKKYKVINRINIGSSLKLCTIAEGSANIYPRFAPTMEWDIAAGQCIVEEAGGRLINHETGKPMSYNKKSLVNPWFVVMDN